MKCRQKYSKCFICSWSGTKNMTMIAFEIDFFCFVSSETKKNHTHIWISEPNFLPVISDYSTVNSVQLTQIKLNYYTGILVPGW